MKSQSTPCRSIPLLIPMIFIQIIMTVAFLPLQGKTQVNPAGPGSASTNPTLTNTAGAGPRLALALADRGAVNALIFSPDSKTLVSANTNRSVMVWDAQTG